MIPVIPEVPGFFSESFFCRRPFSIVVKKYIWEKNETYIIVYTEEDRISITYYDDI